jgi:hypothetical protein
MNRWFILGMMAASACSDYQLSNKSDPTVPLDTGTPPETTSETIPPVIDTGTPPEPSCDDVSFDGWSWLGSPHFPEASDPVDGQGLEFFDPGADLSAWEPITLPDRGIPLGQDRAYVGFFDLAEIPINLSLNLQSDDGIIVWVNGTFVGQWGGEWQAEGCVNENAQCLVTSEVEPVDVTDLLVVGTNVVAARVSNPVANSYFEIIPECVDPVATEIE